MINIKTYISKICINQPNTNKEKVEKKPTLCYFKGKEKDEHYNYG